MSFYRVARDTVVFFMRLGFKIEVIDERNCPLDRGFIIVSNHRTNFDPFFIGIGIKRQIQFMAKAELFKNKFLGFLLNHLGTFPVSRGAGDQSAIVKAEKVVTSGGILGIFPEGTRSKDGILKRAKAGAVVVATESGGDIVPVGINYCGKKGLRRHVIIKYGKPILNSEIKIEGRNKSQIKQACELVMSKIAELLD